MMPIFSLYMIFKKANHSGWWYLTAAVPPLAVESRSSAKPIP